MEKLQATQILKENVDLKAVRFDDTFIDVIEMIEKTNQRQADVLRTKEISLENLNLVVGL